MPEPPLPPANDLQPPLWLKVLVLFVVLWLGVKIIRNVTDSLIGMTGRPHASLADSRN